MDIVAAIKHIIDGDAVIIMGAGASYGAKNAFGELPTGTKLAGILYDECEIDPEDKNDLQDASQCYLEKFGRDALINKIRSLLSCASFTPAQKTIYSLPWMRYYTTNYDDVPLLAASEIKRITPITLSDDYKSNHNKENICLHINGHIGKLNADTLDREFKLTAVSYLSQDHILTSQWGDLLANDLRTAKCIVILGLSLRYDLDLSRIIFDSNQVSKTVIIDRPGLTDNAKNKLERFGTLYQIGIEEFAKQIDSISKSYSPVIDDPEDRCYYAFLHEHKKKKSFIEPMPDSIFRLFMQGDYSDPLFYKTNNKYVGFVDRKQFSDVRKAILSDKKRIVFIESDMGNGKTACLYEVENSLNSEDIHIFKLTDPDSTKMHEEVAAICELANTKRVLIIIDDYANYLDILYEFSIHSSGREQFLLATRSALNTSGKPKVLKDFSVELGQSQTIDLNEIDWEGIDSCIKLFDRYGIWGSKASNLPEEKKKILCARKIGYRRFQSIMLYVIQSGIIKDKVTSLINVIQQESKQFHNAVILILLVNVMNLRLSTNDIERIVGIDIYSDPIFKSNPAINELLLFDGNNRPNIKSSITARYILQQVSKPETIIKNLFGVAFFSQQYISTPKFSNVLKSIISYSHINSFMKGFPNHEEFILAYYDCLCEIDYYRENNFFWLQYAIACIETKRFERAEKYIGIAYTLVPEKFVPFQINNQYARFYFERVLANKSMEPVEDIEKAHKLLMIPIASEKDNEINVIDLFNYYCKAGIRNIMLKDAPETYKKMCSEAFNRTNEYLRSHTEDAYKLQEIKNKLLMYSVEETI